MDTVYLSRGIGEFSYEKFKPVKNARYSSTKPIGGLWACDVKTDDWLKRCRDIGVYFVENLNHKFTFTLSGNARILKLHTKKDLEKVKKYRIQNDLIPISWWVLNFEKLSEDYDVIDYKVKDLYVELYEWDLDCILVLNPNVIILQ